MNFSVKTVSHTLRDPSPELDAYLARPAVDPAAEEVAREVIFAVRREGDAAVARYAKRFDGVDLPPEKFAVGKAERVAALDAAGAEFRQILSLAIRRISAFGKAGMRKNWSMSTQRGGMLAEQFTPIGRVGVYVPGGAAPLCSTALMTIVLAKVAGVPEIAVCTPGKGAAGEVDGHLLAAVEAAGATEVYRIGGIPAIAAMACGTKTVRRVFKIAGPGGPFVTAAKRLVYGDVDLDMVAGPSEIAILADEHASADFVAADFLSQLEHGSGHERALLATPSASLVRAVQKAIDRQAPALSRAEKIAKAIDGALFVVTDTLETAVDVVNRFAPEHLEIQANEPHKWLKAIKNAGAIFLGPWTPEPAGDFAAGPSHVLPTGGTAAFFSGLTVDSFRKRSSVISYTRADLQESLPIIQTLAAMEGLDAHARSAAIRFDAK
ncbi:MAG: histidinol dehydrogenase [Kiritimatiellae bacterium]|nr:histidinol dehydrogenase [Kiritimatiellia bacterium]